MLENETHRLRAMEPHDVELLYALENRSEEWWLGGALNPVSRETLKNFASGQHELWRDLQLRMMVETMQANSQTVGAVDLYQLDPRNKRAGVGIVIEKSERRQGHAIAALELLQSYAFGHLGLHQLWAEIPTSNASSIELFEQAGFVKNGILSDWVLRGDYWEDVVLMQRVASSSL